MHHTTMQDIPPEEAVMNAFFQPMSQMQNTLAILCDCHSNPHHTDPVTHTVLIMITCPIHMQFTAIGWQPFKGKDLTFPYQKMSFDQKETMKKLLALVNDEKQQQHWRVYEHAITFRPQTPPPSHTTCLIPASGTLKALDVLEALCATILKSVTYTDRRMRVAVCNILLQRVQASIPIEKGTLRTLNQRLFPTQEPPQGAT